MSWSLYELSRHPEVQASLREEVLSVMDGRSVPEAADVARMPLLKATIKEVLRYDKSGFSSFPEEVFNLQVCLYYRTFVFQVVPCYSCQRKSHCRERRPGRRLPPP